MATTGERDKARTGTVSRPRSEETARKRLAARRERQGPRRSQDAESVDEALEIERETGRREGARTKSERPVVRYGPKGAPRVDAPPTSPAASSSSGSSSSLSSSSSSSPGGGLGAPLVFDVLIITADEIVNQHRPPAPSRLLVAFAIFGLLGLAKGTAARPAKVFAWGIVVATFYAAAPGDKPAGLNALQGLGAFLAGGNANGSASGGGPGTGSSANATYTPPGGPNMGQTQQHLRDPLSSGAQ